MLSAFNFNDYKPFLREWMAGQDKERGLRSRLSAAAGCQKAYFSQVMNGPQHLSLEQGEALCRFLSLSPAETEYFLLLLLRARAGSDALRKQFSRQIDKARTTAHRLVDQIEKRTELDESARALYYSQWDLAAIHVLVGIAQFRTPSTIARRLQLPVARVRDGLAFLSRVGMLKKVEGGRYERLNPSLYLPEDSPHVKSHHFNWRFKAMEAIQRAERRSTTELHYSAVFTLSTADREKIRETIAEAVKKTHATVLASGDETMCAMALDFFEL